METPGFRPYWPTPRPALESGLGRDPFAGPARSPVATEIWTGSSFLDLAAPAGFMISGVAEIATSLARLARFNGRGPRFYSVAEHSILCDEMARADGVPARFRRAVLMHDAAEAYVGDVTRPLKRLIPGFEAVEERVWLAIAERFDLPTGFDWNDYDDRALAVERREFFPDSPPWGDLPDPGVWQAPRLDMDAAAIEFVRRAEALDIR